MLLWVIRAQWSRLRWFESFNSGLQQLNELSDSVVHDASVFSAILCSKKRKKKRKKKGVIKFGDSWSEAVKLFAD